MGLSISRHEDLDRNGRRTDVDPMEPAYAVLTSVMWGVMTVAGTLPTAARTVSQATTLAWDRLPSPKVAFLIQLEGKRR